MALRRRAAIAFGLQMYREDEEDREYRRKRRVPKVVPKLYEARLEKGVDGEGEGSIVGGSSFGVGLYL